MKLLICLVLIFVGSIFSIDLIDFENMYKKKQFKKISNYGEKYPSKFNSKRGITILSKSNYLIKRYSQASQNCAKGVIEFEMKVCNKILKKIKKIDKAKYFFGLASYYMGQGDFKRAFEKFYDLLKLNTKNDKIRVKLTKMLFKSQKIGYTYEQLLEFKSQPKALSKINERFLIYKRNYTKMFTKSHRDPSEVPISALYYYLMFNPSNDKEKIQILREKIQKFSRYGNSEEEALWLANLLFFEEKYQESNQFLKEITKRLLSPESKLSKDSLQKKLDIKLNKREVKIVEKAVIKSRALARVPVTRLEYSESDFKNAKSFTDSLDLRPLDDSELALASSSNLEVLEEFHKAFQVRNNLKLSDYEERWLFRELDDAEDLLLDNEKTSEALEIYLETEKGKVLKEEYDELHEKILKRDRENSVMYEGELQRFNDLYNRQKGEKSKKIVLSSFVKKWEKTALAQDSNLISQGALNAYRKTDEGKQLAKRIYEIALELKLRPPNLDIGDDFLSERDWD
ncbi:MAG: hypothetical protein COB02_11910 [Candidatus Cloacimonadota bacterium]|nr:MAG: hypothetical protein COB02_11910 [Candidatus Cloacimonadota bacterium]